jgi:hypothetical protein
LASPPRSGYPLPAMFYLGKLLQLSGLVTLIWALVVGIGGNDMNGELALLAIGGTVFLLGSLALRRGGPR